MSIGENIKSLRESRGLTQAQLGDAVGVSDKAVSTWESGKREPRMGVVEKLAVFFNVPKSVLLFGDGDRFHQLPGLGYGTSSYLVDTLMSDPPSREVVEPLLAYYTDEKTAALAGDGLSNDELKLVDIYRNVTEQGRQEMMAHAEYIGERHKKNPSASAGKVV